MVHPPVPFHLQTDVSQTGLETMLTLIQGVIEVPIAYAMYLFTRAKKNDSVSEKKYFTVVWAVKRWRHYLEVAAFDG